MSAREPLTAADDDVRLWTVSTPLMDLHDAKLQVRVRQLTQLCHTPRERMLALYHYVKRLPFAKPVKWRLRSARQVLRAGSGDAEDKATLLVAMLRAAGFPARVEYFELHEVVLRGLTTAIGHADRAVVQVWLEGAWRSTDTYIFDAAYVAAAQQKLRERGWSWGYGIGREGQTLWAGFEDVFLIGEAFQGAAQLMTSLGVFHDPAEFLRSDACRAHFSGVRRTLRWNLAALGINRNVAALRSGRD